MYLNMNRQQFSFDIFTLNVINHQHFSVAQVSLGWSALGKSQM